MAGFIGRTNFLDGTADGASFAFPGFTLPAGMFPGGEALRGPVSFSVRPGSVALRGSAPADRDRMWWVEGRVTERAYLGEHWDYVVQPEGAAEALRITAPPTQALAVGDTVWLGIDPQRIARVPVAETPGRAAA